jgi:cytidylate kinase
LAQQAEIRFDDGLTFIDGKDVTDQLRSAATTAAASRVAQNVAVREALVQQQREWSQSRDVVSEGRDQGTVAFPDAEVKFFLDADPRTRAKRRQQELAAKGENVELDVLLAEQTARDKQDRSRAVAPLRPAPDAIEIDTTNLLLDAVVDKLEAVVREVLAASDDDVSIPSTSV